MQVERRQGEKVSEPVPREEEIHTMWHRELHEAAWFFCFQRCVHTTFGWYNDHILIAVLCTFFLVVGCVCLGSPRATVAL